MDQRSVLLVDRNDDFLDGLCSLLAVERRIRIVGRAHSALEAIDRTTGLTPHLVLMDVSLADVSGFQAVRWLKALRPMPLVLLMTFHETRVTDSAAIAAGADGCLWKAERERLLPTIRELLWPDRRREATTGYGTMTVSDRRGRSGRWRSRT